MLTSPDLSAGASLASTEPQIGSSGPADPRARPPRTSRVRPGRVALHVVLVAAGILFVLPFLWMLLTSFKGLEQLLQAPLSVLPAPWVTADWWDACTALPFARAYANSIYLTVLIV